MKKDDKKLNIVMIGFDWNDISKNGYNITMNKLNRDGLNAGFNNFLLIFAGVKNKREIIRNNSEFIVWHLYFLSKIRVIYDFIFILALPFILLYEGIKPDFFYLYDFPHIFSALIPKLFFHNKIYFRLVNLPTTLALTKGVKGRLYYFYYYLAEKITYRFVDQFIVINKTTKKYLLDIGVKEEKIIFDIPNTIKRDKHFIDQVDRSVLKKHFNIPLEKKIIISIGSLIKEKGFYNLIEVFSELKRDDLILLICGQGSEKEDLIKITEKLGINKKVIFAGLVNRLNIWNYLFASDIFALFSKSESLGMVFWEAMYANLPIIGTPVGGIKETIGSDGQRGFFYNSDIEDLNKKIDFCLAVSFEKEELLKKAKEYVENKLEKNKIINEIFN
ncbi:glycosyltransferase [bacterium]|nr:glycosyltransferase [bacterium]